MGKFVDLMGQKFGRLAVVRLHEHKRAGAKMWVCLCDCGEETIVESYCLRNGNTKSCGCLQRERTRAAATKHGHLAGYKKSTVYQSWCSMIARCHDVTHKHYNKYGGSGITVCDRWRDFANFLADMGARENGMTIERINNSKGYALDNCRWATRSEQQRNRRNNVWLYVNGERLVMVDVVAKYGISRDRIVRALKKGMPIEDIVKGGLSAN